MRRVRLVASAITAVLAAAATPAILFGALARSLDAGAVAFAIALPHALVLGLPLFLLLRAKRRVNALASVVGGFLVGALPIGILSGLTGLAGHGDWGPADLLPTAVLGTFGATGGLAFFLLWRILGAAFERTDAEKPA
jgi:hypothetical protein